MHTHEPARRKPYQRIPGPGAAAPNSFAGPQTAAAVAYLAAQRWVWAGVDVEPGRIDDGIEYGHFTPSKNRFLM